MFIGVHWHRVLSHSDSHCCGDVSVSVSSGNAIGGGGPGAAVSFANAMKACTQLQNLDLSCECCEVMQCVRVSVSMVDTGAVCWPVMCDVW